MLFFHKKKAQCYSMTYYFANVLYLSICMLGNCSGFYFRLLTFIKIKFLQINHPGPPSECQTVWIQIRTDILGSNCLPKGYWQTTKFAAGMQRVITVVFDILSNISSFQLRYTCNVYHKYSDTLNSIHMLCPFKRSKSNIQRI